MGPKTMGSSPAANQNSPSKAPVTPPPTKSPDKFELTTDYIQQTIQQALKKDNLSPEIEQKLLALQQHNQEHDPPLVKKKSLILPRVNLWTTSGMVPVLQKGLSLKKIDE